MNDREKHNHCTAKIVELANQLKDDGHKTQMVSAALMSASCIYATFTAAGNAGALEPTGVDKVVEAYRRNLEHIQESKKARQSKQPPQAGTD